MKVLIDTNVVVDVLQQRDFWFDSGCKIFIAAANQLITGCITAKEAADIHFFSRKQFKGEENADEKTRRVLTKLFTLFEIIDTMADDCQNALAIQNHDYEDAIMIASAQRADVDCIVTRNADHYKSSPVMVCSPDEFLKLLEAMPKEPHSTSSTD